MLYAWAALYKSQLDRGDKYPELRPVVSIWLVEQNVFRGAESFRHRFRVRSDDGTIELSSHLELHVLELDRWRQHPDPSIPAALLGWMRFFTEAEQWTEVPEEIENPVLESAMAVLTDFQTNAALNDLYRSRLDFIRTQNTMQADRDDAIARAEKAEADVARERREKEQERAAKDAALAAKEQERAAKDAALAAKDAALAAKGAALAAKEQERAGKERLRAKLLAAGIDPDAE